jgi:GTP-binding protein
VALRVAETDSADTFLVSGRGELHLAILIETMRREGFEFQVSRPEVIYHQDENGETLEPFEEVHIETSPDTVGVVVEMLGGRRGQMLDMIETQENSVRLTYLVPTRGLLGFRYQFLTATRGMGVMHTIFHGYLPSAGQITSRSTGSGCWAGRGSQLQFKMRKRGILFGPRSWVADGDRRAPAPGRPGGERVQEEAPDQHALLQPGH